MSKKKKLSSPDYFGIPDDENKLIVQKSNPLQTLSKSPLTLCQFKILDAYLSRIDSHNKDKRYVRFEKGQLEKILGVARIRKEELKKHLKNLFQSVTIQDKSKKDGFTEIALFEKAEAHVNDSGLWEIDLACTPSAMEYIFNIENIGYLRYRLKNIISLTSRYSYVLYLYLEKLQHQKTFKISIKKLKTILNCNAETYREYKHFNNLVLKKCQREINQKTNIHFSYKPTDKESRAYTNIIFTIKKHTNVLPNTYNVDKNEIEDKIDHIQNDILKDYDPAQEQFQEGEYPWPEIPEELAYMEAEPCVLSEINYGSSYANTLGAAACADEFTPRQIRAIQDLVVQIFGRDEMAACDYLIHKIHIMDCYLKKSKSKRASRFIYLLRMIQEDLKDLGNML